MICAVLPCCAIEHDLNDNTYIKVVGEIDESTCTIALGTNDQTVKLINSASANYYNKSEGFAIVIEEHGCSRVKNINKNRKYPYYNITIIGPADGSDFMLGSKKIRFTDEDGYVVIPNVEEKYSYHKSIEDRMKYFIRVINNNNNDKDKTKEDNNIVILEMKYI